MQKPVPSYIIFYIVIIIAESLANLLRQTPIFSCPEYNSPHTDKVLAGVAEWQTR